MINENVEDILNNGITSIQYISSETGKPVSKPVTSSELSNLQIEVSRYPIDVWGVYLTEANMHILNSTISSGSSTGLSTALGAINWDTTIESNLRCLYLKDQSKGDEAPNSGILIYNKSNGKFNRGGYPMDGVPDEQSDNPPALNIRYVNDVNDYIVGKSSNPDPDITPNGSESLAPCCLNLGSGMLLTDRIEASGYIMGGSVISNEIKTMDPNGGICTDRLLARSNEGTITIESPVNIKGVISAEQKITTKSEINIESGGKLNVGTSSDNSNDDTIVNIKGGAKIDKIKANNITITPGSENKNKVYIDYSHVLELMTVVPGEDVKANAESKGVNVYIDFPLIIKKLVDKYGILNIENFDDVYTYIGKNYHLHIYKYADGTGSTYKITGYIDFAEPHDFSINGHKFNMVGHMLVDTFFTTYYAGNVLHYKLNYLFDDARNLCVPGNPKDHSGNMWALPFARVSDKHDNISQYAVGLSSMTGPYTDSNGNKISKWIVKLDSYELS